jgi:ribosome maturation factor RimP
LAPDTFGRLKACPPIRMSDKKSIEQKIQSITGIAEEIANPLGLIVVDIRFGQQGRRHTLDVTIFKKESWVSLSDCEQLSRLLEAELDKRALADGPMMEGTFDLQVQSPGIDRQLKTEREFKVFAGQRVQVQTKAKVGELGVHFKGILMNCADGKVQIGSAEAIKQQSTIKQQSKGKKNQPQERHHDEVVTLDAKNLINVKLFAESLQKRVDTDHVKKIDECTLEEETSDQNRR